MQTPIFAGDVYSAETRRDTDALRGESLAVLTLIVFELANVFLVYLAFVQSDLSFASWIAPVGLFLICGQMLWLGHRRPALARLCLPIELMLLIILHAALRPNSLGILFALPVIVVSSILVSPGWMLAIAGGSCLALAGLLWWNGLAYTSLYGVVIMISALTAFASWFAAHNLYTAVEWALYSHKQAQESMTILRERRAELRQMADALRQNQERMHYLNVRLEQAKVAAEEAYRTKQHFVANVSHELRTPLNLITGFSEMMAFSPESYGGVRLPAQYQEDVMEIYRSSKHLLGLVEDVLALAQLEAGQMIIQREWNDLAEVIQEATDTMRPLVEGKGLTLETDIPPDLPSIYIDAGRIRQVLLNLLNNAYRFTEKGGIRVSVERSVEQLTIQVRDSGVGIAAEDLPRIFEEFHNLSGGPSARRSGFGLGLSISRRLIESHGGQLWAESMLGSGSSFYITLPLTDEPSAVRRPTLIRTTPRAQVERTKPVILEVGEEPGQGMLTRHLGDYRIVHVRPEQAMSACEHYLPIAIWINDGGLHLRTSGEIAPVLRAAPSLPVITCRVPTQGDIARRLRADLYIPKPLTQDKIAEALTRLSKQRPIHSILIIDDDPRMVRLLQRILDSLDEFPCRVIEACGGKEGLEMLTSERPDVVLLDLAMPEVSGYDVLEVLHRQPEYRETRVVLMTGVELNDETTPVYRISVRSQGGFPLVQSLQVIREMIKCLAPRTMDI